MRPIDADRLKAVLEKNFGHTGGASVLEQLIDEQPTIEPSTNCSEIPNSSDTISRQEAIDALKEHRALYCDNTPETFSKLSYVEKSRVDELDTAIATLVNLPTVQPVATDTNVGDTISRRATINAVNNAFDRETLLTGFVRSIAVRAIRDMPSVQPEKAQLSREGTTFDLISRTETVEHLRRMLEATVPNTDYDEGFIDGVEFGISTVSTMPSAQPEPQEGHWINGKCDLCGEHAPFWAMASTYHESNYCPNCGAKMKGVTT